MINIILVDDEYLIRAKLNKYLKEYPFEINTVFEASNGLDALKIINNESISIAIIDIKMPLMSGIELAKNILETSPITKLIFLTGFEKFEYAREAVNLNVISYLLKPVNKDELYDSLKKCLNIMNSEYKSYLLSQEILEKEKYQYLTDSINYSCDYSDSPFNLKDDNFTAISVEVLNESSISFLYNFLNKNFNYYDIIYGLSTKNKIILVNNFDNISEVFKTLIEKRILKYCYLSRNTSSIRNSFSECLNIFPSRIFFKEHSFFSFNDIFYKSLPLPNTLRLDFELLIKSQSDDELICKFNSYFEKVCDSKDIHALKILLRSFFLAIENIFSSEDISLYTLDVDYLITTLLYSNYSLKELKLYCQDYFKSIFHTRNTPPTSDSIKTIYKVKEFLDVNYTSDNINLDYLANIFFINSCHLSSTFKKVTGERLIEYITKKRIDKAKILLKENNMKIVDISEKVGYKDYYYFSKLFKKYEGVSPLKYKKLI